MTTLPTTAFPAATTLASFSSSLMSLIGRLLLAAVFVPSGLSKIAAFSDTAGFMASVGMPLVQPALVAAIAFEVVFGLFVLVGFKVRIAVAGLVLFLILATYYFHNPLAFEGQERQMQMIQLFKNAAIAGGLLMIAANGPGRWSIDGRRG